MSRCFFSSQVSLMTESHSVWKICSIPGMDLPRPPAEAPRPAGRWRSCEEPRLAHGASQAGGGRRVQRPRDDALVDLDGLQVVLRNVRPGERAPPRRIARRCWAPLPAVTCPAPRCASRSAAARTRTRCCRTPGPSASRPRWRTRWSPCRPPSQNARRRLQPPGRLLRPDRGELPSAVLKSRCERNSSTLRGRSGSCVAQLHGRMSFPAGRIMLRDDGGRRGGPTPQAPRMRPCVVS